MKAVEDFREDLKRIEDSLALNFSQMRNVNPVVDFSEGYNLTVDVTDFEVFKDEMFELDTWHELPMVSVMNNNTGMGFEAFVVRVDKGGIYIVDEEDYELKTIGFNDLYEIRDRLELYEAMLKYFM